MEKSVGQQRAMMTQRKGKSHAEMERGNHAIMGQCGKKGQERCETVANDVCTELAFPVGTSNCHVREQQRKKEEKKKAGKA
jgi:hypothetical protein